MSDSAPSSRSHLPEESTLAAETASSTAAMLQLAAELGAGDVLDLANDFLGDIAELKSSLAEQLAIGDTAESMRLAHSMKGTSSIFALHHLVEAAMQIEMACKENDLEAAREMGARIDLSVNQSSEALQLAIHTLKSSTPDT